MKLKWIFFCFPHCEPVFLFCAFLFLFSLFFFFGFLGARCNRKSRRKETKRQGGGKREKQKRVTRGEGREREQRGRRESGRPRKGEKGKRKKGEAENRGRRKEKDQHREGTAFCAFLFRVSLSRFSLPRDEHCFLTWSDSESGARCNRKTHLPLVGVSSRNLRR